MGRYRSRSRSYSPRRSSRHDDRRDSRPRRESYRRSPPPSGLLVRNIPLDARPEDVRASFEKFGPIKDVYLPKNYYTGEPRGFGFVKFRHPEDAADAKDHLNYTVFGGRELTIVFAEESRRTPREMRSVPRMSDRESYRRRSPVKSTRRHYRSPSHSPSPARSDLRNRRARDDRYSPRRAVPRSTSPRDEREYRSERVPVERSRSVSGSPAPREQKKYRPSCRSPSPNTDGRARDEVYDEPERSPRARGKGHTFPRSPSPRGNVERYRDERSSSPRKKVLSPVRSTSPRGNGGRSRHERYSERYSEPDGTLNAMGRRHAYSRLDRSPSPRGNRDETPSPVRQRLAHSRSHRSLSPRGNVDRSRVERSPSPWEKVLSPLRSPSPRGNGRRSRHESYGEPDKSLSSRDNVHIPARHRSQSYSPR